MFIVSLTRLAQEGKSVYKERVNVRSMLHMIRGRLVYSVRPTLIVQVVHVLTIYARLMHIRTVVPTHKLHIEVDQVEVW